MEESQKPLFLFADSQPLFWRDESGELFLRRIREALDDDVEEPRAAYIGASNQDRPEFYELFRGAMESIGVTNTKMIPSEPTQEESAYVGRAHIILLAGGDVHHGYKVMEENGLATKVVQRHQEGAVIMGVSAGAVQIGLFGPPEENAKSPELPTLLKILPFFIDVHDDPEWPRMMSLMPKAGEHIRGFGIPTGGGAIFHPDMTLEPIRHPLTEFKFSRGRVRHALVMSPTPEMEAAEEAAAEAQALEAQEEAQQKTQEKATAKRKKSTAKKSAAKGGSKKVPVKKPPTKKPATKKPATKKPATKKPATKQAKVLEPEILAPDPLGIATPSQSVRRLDDDETVN